MRSFIISLIILALCFTASVINSLWTKSIIEDFTDTLSTLEPSDAHRLSLIWNDIEGHFTFSIRKNRLREITDSVERLEAAADCSDLYQFESERSALIYKMKELCLSQSFDLRSVF